MGLKEIFKAHKKLWLLNPTGSYGQFDGGKTLLRKAYNQGKKDEKNRIKEALSWTKEISGKVYKKILNVIN